MIVVKFTVAQQTIKRIGNYKLVQDSKNFVQLDFQFLDNSWGNATKTALFKTKQGESYAVIMENNSVIVPEICLAAESFTISLLGNDIDNDIRITTNALEIELGESGYEEGETPPNPKPPLYEQIMNHLAESVGKKAPDGGEIFGDYDSNKAYGKTAAAFGSGSVAGSKGFNIQSYDADARTVILDSLVGLEVGFVCSMRAREKHFDLFGKITGINGNVVTFDSFPNFAEFADFDYEKDIPTMLWIPDHPELGTTIIDSASFVGGDGCKSTGENSVSFNTYNKSIGKHSATFGKGNIAAFAALAINFMNKALGRSSLATGVLNETTPEAEGAFVGGNSSKAKHPFTFVFGKFLSTAAKFQAIFGFFNKPNEDALFQVGNGIHDNDAQKWEPRTAFEVLKDGSAKVQTQGTDDNSIVQLATLDERVKGINRSHQEQLDALFETAERRAALLKNHQEQIDLANSRIDGLFSTLQTEIARLEAEIAKLK